MVSQYHISKPPSPTQHTLNVLIPSTHMSIPSLYSDPYLNALSSTASQDYPVLSLPHLPLEITQQQAELTAFQIFNYPGQPQYQAGMLLILTHSSSPLNTVSSSSQHYVFTSPRLQTCQVSIHTSILSTTHTRQRLELLGSSGIFF